MHPAGHPLPARLTLPVYDLVGNDTGALSGGKLFELPLDVPARRMGDRESLLKNLDRLRTDVDASGSMAALGKYEQQAVSLLTGGRVREALNLAKEPAATREKYSKHLWCQQALLARRLVEAGTRRTRMRNQMQTIIWEKT